MAVVTTLAEKIAARLNAALTHHQRAGITKPAERRGMAVGGPDDPRIVLSMEDVARIAALTSEDHFDDQSGRG